MTTARLAAALALAALPLAGLAQVVTAEAEQVLALQRSGTPHVLLDARTAEEFAQAHIPGAIHLPPERVKAEARRLPADRSTTLVFYCRGAGCTLSWSAASEAVDLGYGRILIYRAGFPDWLLRGLPVEKGAQPARRP
jgi:rhodanese-related sulfurtransferase